MSIVLFFFFSSRRRHTRYWRDWSSDVCSSDLAVRVMIGSVVSIVVAPPAEIGARLPNQRTNRGAASNVSISLQILANNAIVPNSGPLDSVMKILESE